MEEDLKHTGIIELRILGGNQTMHMYVMYGRDQSFPLNCLD